MAQRCIASVISARAVVNVLEARLRGDGERGSEEWETIRMQAAQLVSFAKWKRDEARKSEPPRSKLRRGR